MPLHDWKDERGWDGMHLLWLAQLIEWIQPLLPVGYRAYVGSVPALSIDSLPGRPDLSVRSWNDPPRDDYTTSASTAVLEPRKVVAAKFEVDPQRAIYIELHGRLVSALELVSPRNKDRTDSKERYLNRYAGYLRQGVHLMLVDALPAPAGFSFAELIAAELGFATDKLPPPYAVSYCVEGPLPEGTELATWSRKLEVGKALPNIPLPLAPGKTIPVDLEITYTAAAKLVYLD